MIKKVLIWGILILSANLYSMNLVWGLFIGPKYLQAYIDNQEKRKLERQKQAANAGRRRVPVRDPNRHRERVADDSGRDFRKTIAN